jgi:ParB-like chromosome segregation protein Spo0J
MSDISKTADSRNCNLSFHPLADIFPLMEGEEFDALVADIKANGLRELITVYQNKILDGRNRYRACRALGIEPRLTPFTGDDEAARAFVISKNLHRRHLTAEKRRELIANLIKAQPEKSDRAIAEPLKVSPTTVGTVRADLVEKGQVSKLDTRTDKRGRKQPAKKPTKKPEAKQPVRKPVKPDPRIIAPELADRVGRFAHDLILSERLLARELANIIMLPGVCERLSADLTNGLALDAGVDAGPLRRRS